MKLKFLPRPGHMVPFAAGNAFGQLSRFAGRSFVPSGKPGFAGAYVADAEPIEVDPDGDDAAHFIRQARKGDPGLWPADAATAAACGVEFVAVSRDANGEWKPAAKAAPVVSPKKSEPKAEG